MDLTNINESIFKNNCIKAHNEYLKIADLNLELDLTIGLKYLYLAAEMLAVGFDDDNELIWLSKLISRARIDSRYNDDNLYYDDKGKIIKVDAVFIREYFLPEFKQQAKELAHAN